MTVGAVVEVADQLGAQVAMGLALTKARGDGAKLWVFCAPDVGGEDELNARLERAIQAAGGDPQHVQHAPFEAQRPGALLSAVTESGVTTLLLVRHESKRSDALRKRVLARASCAVVVWIPRESDDRLPRRILVPMARGVHAKAALKLGLDLAGEDGEVTALYVEPDVGIDAGAVGERVLRKLVEGALGERASDARREVVIGNQVWRGILSHVEEGGYDLVLLGASKLTEFGQKLHGTVGLRVSEAADGGASVGIVRGPGMLLGRFRSFVERTVLRAVPQLQRDARIQLVERVQSNSHWDFDFVALMSMATVIAAVGLVLNSEAVVIGAMLVAPLMTPILGLGLALVHGNPLLGRAAFRTVTFGFLTAFAIGLVLGLVQPGFAVPTSAMAARHWPGLLDLVIAFVAGMAGAYSSSRPSLLAALPGVAIAAALVPPIATSGLAVALGDWPLASGASMLFFTNMVGIILAAAICLWMVGMREVKPRSRANRLAGFGLIGVVLALGAWYSPSDVPSGFRSAVEVAVEGYRVDGPIRTLRADGGETLVVVRLAGTNPPPDGMVRVLREIARGRFGEPDLEVRLDWQWEQSSLR